jgi:hypothetical protein
MKRRVGGAITACLAMMLCAAAQQPSVNTVVASASAPVPRLMRYSGIAKDGNGKPLSGPVGITFLFYKDEQGGAPLWLETQNVQGDAAGRYSVRLGASQASGLPSDLFISGEARWLGVQISGQAEQRRVLLLSVPYALKAGDAETVGGLPASAFALAAPANANPAAASAPTNAVAPPGTTPVTTAGGTVNTVPKFDSNADITNSQIFDTGTNVGVGISSPTSKLDVKGAATIRGTLLLPAAALATAAVGGKSQPENWVASSFNSGTAAAVNQTFQLRAEPAGNDTASPSATLNLLFGSGTTAPLETGLHIASNGQITFATGQTFPGTGTLTGITTAAGSGLTGGGTSGNLSLALINTCATGQALLWSGSAWACSTVGTGTITAVTAGTDLTGGGTAGIVTLNLDSTKVPRLKSANTFTATQTVSTGDVAVSSGNIDMPQTTSSTVGVITLDGNPFLHGYGGVAGIDYNTFLGATAGGGFATSGAPNTGLGYRSLFSNTSGYNNVAVGAAALGSNTSGHTNTAAGDYALLDNTTGVFNTAIGSGALANSSTGSNNTAAGQLAGQYNQAGSNNTFLGYLAGPDTNSTALSNATALGANSVVSESNALVLGGTGANAVKVGIGTATPAFGLDVHGTGNFTGLVTFAAGQAFPGTGTITGITAGAGLTGGGTSGGVTLSLASNACGAGSALTALPEVCSPFATLGANAFSGNQTITGNLSGTGNITASGAVTGSVITASSTVTGAVVDATTGFNIAGNPFAFGNYYAQNAFLGFSGSPAATGTYNTANGYFALDSDSTGYQNTATGATALEFDTTGYQNTASGFQALAINSTGNENTASGYDALGENGTGSLNTADGFAALLFNTLGSNNTALGFMAGPDYYSNDLNYATAIGSSAVVSASNAMTLGAPGPVSSASGQVNVGIGTAKPAYRLDLSYGEMIVRGFTPFNLGGEISNLYVGDNVHGMQAVNGQGTYILSCCSPNALFVQDGGNVGIGTNSPANRLTVAQGAGAALADGWATYSSRRWKTKIQPIQNALGKVQQLRGVTYDLKDSGKHEIGVIAEEVGEVVPELVSFENNGKDARGVDYSRLTALLIEAVKQQQRQISAQQRQIKSQRSQIARLSGKVNTLETTLKTGARSGELSADLRSPAMGAHRGD